MHGLDDDLTEAERKVRNEQTIPDAPEDVQLSFEKLLGALSARNGFHSAGEYVTTVLKNKMFHFTYNYLGDHTMLHNDEWLGDAPGWYVSNTALSLGGLLLFTGSEASETEQTSGVWHAEGDMAVFSGDLRTRALHTVIKYAPVVQVTDALTDVRIVATIRGGEVPVEKQASWYDLLESGVTTP